MNTMKNMITLFYIRTPLHLLLAFFILTSCAINPVTGERELMLVSEKQEMQLGISASPSANWEFGGHYREPALESYLGNIVRRLWAASERSQMPFEFHIQNSSIPNAFALPGYVAITRGLLSEMGNEAQFAAVMGHEIGHVMARHTAQRLSRVQLQQLGLVIGATALEGTSGRDTFLKVGAIGSSLLLMKYDRGQELQADRLGVKYMSTIGYDPYEALSAHEVLEHSVDAYLARLGRSPREDTFVSSLLSTHPRKEVRLSEIQSMIAMLPPYRISGDGKFSKVFASRTENIKKVNGFYGDYDKAELNYKDGRFKEAEETIRKAMKASNAQAPFHNLLGFIKLQQKNYPEAEKSFTTALTLDPQYQPSMYGFGLLRLFEEKYGRAIKAFGDSLKFYPNHAASHFGMGKSYFKSEQYTSAISYLENFSKAAPKHPEVHGLLGVCFDMTKNIVPAVREYSYQVQIAPDTEMGNHAKSRLAVLQPLLEQNQ
jgi:predicted Zn-dependent protease